MNFSDESAKKIWKQKLCFVGKKVICREKVAGPYIGSFYIIAELIKKVEDLVFFETKKIKLKSVVEMLSSDSIWLIYPVRRKVGLLVSFISILFNKKLIIFINDLPILQARDLTLKKKSITYITIVKFIELLLFLKADIVISTSPCFFNHIRVRTRKKIVFPPGISDSDQIDNSGFKKQTDTHILLYAGSLDRSGMITKLSTMFAEIEGWQFWIAGEGKETINMNKNVNYLGLLSQVDIQSLYSKVDAIVIPYPQMEYYNLVIPLKTGEVLATGKPIIMMRLKGIRAYLNFLNIKDNVIFVDEWSRVELVKALERAKSTKQNLKIEDLQNRLSEYTWDKRTTELIEIIENEQNIENLMWI